MQKRLASLLKIAMGVALLAGVVAQAVAAPESVNLISRDEAAMKAMQRVNGRILSIKLRHEPPPPVYRVKVLSNGDVHVLDVDARRPGGEKRNARPGR